MWNYFTEFFAAAMAAALVAGIWKHYGVLEISVWKRRIWSVGVFGIFELANILMGVREMGLEMIGKWELLLILLMAVAGIDHRKRIIPNKILLAAIILRSFIYIPEFMIDKEGAEMVLIKDILGAGICFGVLFIICVLTKQQIGAGDVKLFGVIGYILGIAGAYNTLFYAMLFALVCGMYHMLVHREGRQFKMAFAPFACLGCICVLVLKAF